MPSKFRHNFVCATVYVANYTAVRGRKATIPAVPTWQPFKRVIGQHANLSFIYCETTINRGAIRFWCVRLFVCLFVFRPETTGSRFSYVLDRYTPGKNNSKMQTVYNARNSCQVSWKNILRIIST